MLESELRINVLQAFEKLTHSIDVLCQAILDDTPMVAWMQPLDMLPEANQVDCHRQRACLMIRQLEYLDNQAPREILVSAGFIGASDQTIQLSEQLNNDKEHFKQAVLALKAKKLSIKDDAISKNIQNILKKRPEGLQLALQQAGLSRLHLKQCYRQIPILPHAPKKISWTWAHTRSIKKITVAQAEQLLNQKGDNDNIALQRKKLYGLSDKEPLAIIQELAPHLRANIVFDVNNQTERMMIKGPMPIFFPADTATPMPIYKQPAPKQDKDKNRVIRSDVKIDPNPFLPSIRAHRYASFATNEG